MHFPRRQDRFGPAIPLLIHSGIANPCSRAGEKANRSCRTGRCFRKLGVASSIERDVCDFPREAPPALSRISATAGSSRLPPSAPLTLDEVIKLIKQGKKNPQQVISAMAARGVDFDLDEKTEKKLRKAGADDELLPEIWKATPKGKAHMEALLTTPTGVEIKARRGRLWRCRIFKMKATRIIASKWPMNLRRSFRAVRFLSYVDTAAAKAHQEKGDLDDAVQDGPKSLKLDPDNTFSLIILALVLPQPKELQGNRKEVGEQLAGGEGGRTNPALTCWKN